MEKRLTEVLLGLCGLLIVLVVVLSIAERPVRLTPQGTDYADFAALAEEVAPMETTATAAESEAQPTGLIDLNTATREELMTLSGIGEVMAGRILEEREFMPFESVDDLLRVKGIGEKTLEKIRPFVTV